MYNTDEEWDVLDELGNPTGEIVKKKDPRAYEKGVYHGGADVWIINSENKFLIQKRSQKKKVHPNVWAMTGGSVIRGETPQETLLRECFEELEINIDINKLKWFTRFKTECVWIDNYILREDFDISKMVYKEDEVSEVKWASWEEIDNLVKNNEFIIHRWEFVGELLKKELENN